MRHLSSVFTSILAILLLSGCASAPVVTPAPDKIVSGDQMQRDSEGMSKLSKRWQEGKMMVEKGQAQERDAQKAMEGAHDLISEGNKIMRESEEGYKSIKQ